MYKYICTQFSYILPISFPRFFQQRLCLSEVKRAWQRAKLVSCLLLRSDWWYLISSLPCNHLACGWKNPSYLVIYTCEGLLEELNIKHLTEELCECLQLGKNKVTSKGLPTPNSSLTPNFHAMYFNVRINRNVKLSLFSYVLVSSSLPNLIKLFNLCVSLTAPFLKQKHPSKTGNKLLIWAPRNKVRVHRPTDTLYDSNSARTSTSACFASDPPYPGLFSSPYYQKKWSPNSSCGPWIIGGWSEGWRRLLKLTLISLLPFFKYDRNNYTKPNH